MLEAQTSTVELLADFGPNLGTRVNQAFPDLTPDEVERLRRFGSVKRFAAGERMFAAGTPRGGMFVVLKGQVTVSQRDGLGHVTPILQQGPGQFLAEVGTLSDRPSFVDGHANGAVEALVIPSDELRALLIAEAELGERMTRALILRRVSLIESNTGGVVLIGPADDSDVVRLQNFLRRNGLPHRLLDPDTDAEARDVIARHGPAPSELPLVVALDGKILRNPGEHALGCAIGMITLPSEQTVFDVAVVGAGPAGMSTAVYAASEGLSVAVLDSWAFGGQAGASARIENYLGFPTGISGMALAGRAYVQAMKFGAEMMIPVEVKSLDCARKDENFVIEIDDGMKIRSRAVVVASGARYRRPAVGNLKNFEGCGVRYWASPIEARLCVNEEVILVGGGNSAGQAAVFLCTHAKKVRMMVRGEGLAATMSRYLIDRIKAAPNIELMTHTEIVKLDGDPDRGLERVHWKNRKTGKEDSAAIRNVFLFIGADPATGWLAGCGVDVDKSGFVITGSKCSQANAVNPLQSSVAGVFAVGDVRAGSIKRVGSGIGEGAQVVAALHRFLAPEENV
jgi:thioredoxin reductase (NADPH)